MRGKESAMWKLAKFWALFGGELRLVWAMLRDARTPAAAKVTAMLALLYILSPLDLVPDLIPLPEALLASLKARAAARGRKRGKRVQASPPR
jgi:hypothetical protein